MRALAPIVDARSADGLSREVPAARFWGAALAVVPAAAVLLLATARRWPCCCVALPGSRAGDAWAKLAFKKELCSHHVLIQTCNDSTESAQEPKVQ